jgi:hypothetical protein
MTENWAKLLPQIEYLSRPFPRSAITFANTHRDEVAPYLIDALTQTAEKPMVVAEDADYMLHLYAMHLLASWCDTRAYSSMVKMGHHPYDVIEDILGDTVTETYGRCLASVCDGNVGPLYSLFEDVQASPWTRNAALDALIVRVFEGDYPRDDLIQYLKSKGESEALRLRRPDVVHGDLEILDYIVSAASDISAVEMSDQIAEWFDDQLLDTSIADKQWVLTKIAQPFETHRDLELGHGRGYLVDVEKEISWWYMFSEQSESNFTALPPLALLGKKIGRNEPCPCGSGKKYKKCHGFN